VKHGSVVFAVFGLLLSATALLLFMWDDRPLTYGLLGGAAAASFLTAIVVFSGRRAAPESDPDLVRAVPYTSWAAVAIGVGGSLMAVGVVFGVYLVMIGAGLVIAGLVALFRERRAPRHALPPYAHGPLGPNG